MKKNTRGVPIQLGWRLMLDRHEIFLFLRAVHVPRRADASEPPLGGFPAQRV